MTLNVLVVSAFAGQGGTGRWLSLALPALARQVGLRCVLKYGAHDLRKSIGAAHSQEIVVCEAPLQSPGRLFGVVQLLREVRRSCPDVIMAHHTFSMVGLCLLRLLGFLRKTPFIVVVHSAGDEFPHVSAWKRRVVEELVGLTLNRADVVVAVAQYIEKYLRSTPLRRHRIALIHNGFPISYQSHKPVPSASARLRVGFVGRFSIEKGADRIIDLIERLKAVSIEWHVAGGGLLESSIRGDLQKHIDAGTVQYHGWTSDPLGLMRTLDVLIVISRTEGCPFSVLEAHTCGTLVVSLPVGGMPEAVENGAAGILVDNLDAMADVLRKLTEGGHPPHQQLLARAAELMRERYSLDGMVQKYLQLIHETVGDGANCLT